ncbi:MAG: response regulator [Eubacteriales bacterium]|nr:response regulator [Eubacteriales bacterium]
MRILALDDERTALNILSRAIAEAVPDAELLCFSTVTEALKAMGEENAPLDVAFLDIEMPGMTGLELAHLIKTHAPMVNIVFVTGYSQYALEALSVRPSGYIMKPVDAEQIRVEIKNLRHPPSRTVADKRIRAQCFGDFELFVDGKAVPFSRAKSKELLAFLIDRRGASCTTAKIADALWEDGVYDRARQKLLSTICIDMQKSLKQVGAEQIVLKTNNLLAINPEAFDCDYYRALSGDVASINRFMGEYMAAYSWAEFTTGALTTKFSAMTDE